MNNINQKIKESLSLKKKAITLLSKAIAKIILKFKLSRSEFILALDENLVLEAKKQDPEASNVTIAIRTGIDRRAISKHLKGEMPHSRPDKMAIILEDIHWTANKVYNSTKIPKIGPFKTFQSICEQCASGTLTYKPILEEFVKNGNLIDHGKTVELVNLMPKTIQDDVNYSQITANQINRVVNTMVFNSEAKESQEILIQRSVFSTQINPTKFINLHLELKQKTEKFRNIVNDLMLSYEDDVNVGTYPEYGYSFLEYNIEKRS